MSKDSTPEILKQMIDEIYKSGNLELPERRRMSDRQVIHCDVHDKVHVMYQAIYGPDNKPEEGLLHITKNNAKFLDKLNGVISKLTWFILLAGLSAMGSFMIQLGKMLVKNG